MGFQLDSNSSVVRLVIAIVFGCSVVVVSFVVWWFVANTNVDTPQTIVQESEIYETPEVVKPEEDAEVPRNEAEKFDSTAITSALETWVASTAGQASIVIATTDGEVLASNDADRQYFAASIYKLYVAYEGYRELDAGEKDPDEDFINGHTREECLDLMIRESDSPCAEKLWVEIGQETVDEIMKGYGLRNTSMTSIRTSAQDAATILVRIVNGEGLSPDSQAKLLASMKDQIFRDALNKGFSENVVVYNKIGFNELVEYHDTAIIELSDGHQLIVSVLTERVGTRNIATLAAKLEAALID